MKLAVLGANGRIGQLLVQEILSDASLELVAALVRPKHALDHTSVGSNTGIQTDLIFSSDLECLQQADVAIDFTRPLATMNHLSICTQYGIPMVIGTTGLSGDQKKAIASASRSIPIVQSTNMSIGVTVLIEVLKQVSSTLGPDYDVEIFEMHHKHKVDAPSGTALSMGEAVASAWNKNLDDVADWARHGDTGERIDGRIGFSVARGGDVIGDHTAFFCGSGERLEFSHRAASRAPYINGAIKAATFLKNKTSGLFTMKDVLGM